MRRMLASWCARLQDGTLWGEKAMDALSSLVVRSPEVLDQQLSTYHSWAFETQFLPLKYILRPHGSLIEITSDPEFGLSMAFREESIHAL
jgi:hypothetical protein